MLTLVYMYTYRQNRELEMKTAVYPILNHFNTMVKATDFIIIMLATTIFMMYFFTRTFTYGLLFAICFILIYSLVFIPQVQYVLHLLLAIQRLLLYFSPSSEKYVNLSEKAMGRLIKVLYVLCFIKDVWKLIQFIRNYDEAWSSQFLERIMEILIILQLISALAYIPVIISIRKLTNLVSIEKYKPHKYIFYQMMASLAIRLPFVFFIVTAELTHGDFTTIFIIPVSDIFLTPISIQLAYLLCNRRNVQVLLSFSPKNAIKALIFPGFQPNQVAPEVVESTRAH